MAGLLRSSWTPFRWITPKLAVFSAAIFVAACADGGCDCAGFEQAKFPEQHYDKTVPNGGQIRLTESGLDFMEGQVPDLISQFRPGGLSLCVPKNDASGANPKVCVDHTCNDRSAGCQLDLTVADAQISPVPSDRLEVAITIGDIGGKAPNGNWRDELDIEYDAGFLGTADCDLHLWKKNGDKDQAATLDAKVPLTFTTDQNSTTHDLQVDVGDIQMQNLTDQVSYKLDGGLRCTVGNWLSGLLEGQLEGQVQSMLQSTVNGIEAEQLCRACGADRPACPAMSSCGTTSGVQTCKYNAGGCVPRTLGIEGKLEPADIIGDSARSDQTGVYVMAKAADHAAVDTGVSLGMRVGAQPVSFGRCIPVDPANTLTRPSFEPVDLSETILSDTRPNGDPFMVGIGVHKRTIEHLLWSTWSAGGLCLSIDSNTLPQLSTRTLGTLLPSIEELAGAGAMVVLQLAPQRAPTVELGANDVILDGNSYDIDDPLVTVDWKDVDLHVYVFAQQRFVRVFTLRADLSLPIAVRSDGHGKLIPVLGDLGDAIGNIRPVRTGLLKEDPQKLVDLIPSLVSLALPGLVGSISKPIELPEILGLRIALDGDDITSIDNDTMVALFADLAPAAAQPYSMGLQTSILGTRVDVDHHTDAGIPRPRVTVDVATELPAYATGSAATDLEYSYRVDGGVWSLYRRSTSLVIQDPLLVFEGRHRIEVRARLGDQPGAAELQPTQTKVVVDYSAPELSIERAGPVVTLAGHDAATRQNDLTFRYRLVDGQTSAPWTRWGAEPAIDLAKRDAPRHLRVVAQVKDRAGHVGEAEQNIVWKSGSSADTTAPDASTEPRAGCQAAQDASPSGVGGELVAVIGLALLLWRRRRIRQHHRSLHPGRSSGLYRLGIFLSAVVITAAGGCDDNGTGGRRPAPGCEPACTDQQTCVDGACRPEASGCESDSECSCAEGEIGACTDDGTCSCQMACSDGCGEGQFCCYRSNACQDIPGACADKLCDPGFEPRVASAGTPDSSTCQLGGASCECVALDALPIGIHGAYAAVAEGGGVRAVSVYNRTYTDLMVGALDGNDEPTWYFVDGIPDSADIEGDPGGPRGGVADKGADVGTHTAIGVDADANLHVIYRDEDAETLKYARGKPANGGYQFATTTLDAQGDTGYWTSLVVRDGVVYAVYANRAYQDPDDGWQTQVRYLQFPAAAQPSDIDAAPQIVYADATANPCGDACTGGESCFTASEPVCAEDTDDCHNDCGNGLACLDGMCQTIYLRGERAYPKMVGVSAQLSLADGGLAVAFTDYLRGQVGWARRTDGSWEDAQFLGEPSGPYVSGAVGAHGKLHLAYMNPTDQSLVYKVVGQGPPEVIADGVRDSTDGYAGQDMDGYVLAAIGEDVDLSVADDGGVRVIFQDATLHKLRIASRDAGGAWSVNSLGEPGEPYTGAHGFFGTLLKGPSGAEVAAEFVLDNQADPATGTPHFYRLP